MKITDAQLIELPEFTDDRGQLCALEAEQVLPFPLKRIAWIYGVPTGKIRSGHAHRQCHEFLIAISGSFDVKLDDGIQTRIITLGSPHRGLHIPPGIRATQYNFSSAAICLLLASHSFDEKDHY